MERFIKYNSNSGFGPRTIAMVYANANRIKDAREMLEKGTKGMPEGIKNVAWFMSNWPFKDLQTAQHFAEGYVKAGLPGDSSKIFKIMAENRLTKKEITDLFFGKQVTGYTLSTGKQWWVQRSLDGKATVHDGDDIDSGKSWIENDMLCDQWNNLYEGLKDCWVIYRNPGGTSEGKDEFLGAPGYSIYPYSIVE
jgi:hypothetical protein